MKAPLEVLIIEDSEADALLLSRQLRSGGYDPVITRVESAVELAEALPKNAFDVVICDYRLPQFSGLEALRMVLAHGRDVPIILVSGVVGEDQAVAAMKAGAHDFILKDQLARLVPAVQRELREADVRRKRREAEAALQRAHAELESRVRQRTAELLEANEALQRANRALERWSQLFEHAHWGVAVGSASGQTLEMMNPAYARMHGYSVAELTGAPVLSIATPDSRTQLADQIRLVNTQNRAIFESRHLRKDGTSFPALVEMAAVRDERGRPLYRVIYTQDISELKSLEARILDISEREQQRIGQDLHDSLCQQLSGIAYLCHTAHERIAQVAPSETGLLIRISQLLQEAMDQARGVAYGLHPVEGEANGLAAALEGLAGHFRSVYSISTLFLCAKPVPISDNTAATHLYRIAQEAMRNAVEHGRARQIVVRLAETKSALTLSIQDDGCGFPLELPVSRGLGLETMRFRARAIGADLNVGRGARGGTVVTCIWRNRTPAATKGPPNE